MQSKTVETFLSENYNEIVTMSSKICGGHQDHLDVAHYCIANFIEHVRAEELVKEGRAMNFLSGMIHRSFRSSTSPYHKLYRQSGRVYANDELFRLTTDGNEKYGEDSLNPFKKVTGIKGQRQKMYENLEHINTDYDFTIDYVTEAILGILEEMKLMSDEHKDIWYMAVLFELWLDTPNYSELSRKTNIPRTSISQAVQQCKEYIQEELKNRNINL